MELARLAACGDAPISTRPSVSVGVGSRRTSIARRCAPAGRELARLGSKVARIGSSRRNAAQPAPLPAPG
jgi:hypothetical protein